jgi:hypothetical protein
VDKRETVQQFPLDPLSEMVHLILPIWVPVETGNRMVFGSSDSPLPPYVLQGYHLDTGYRMVLGSSVAPLPHYVLHGYHLDTGYRMVFGSSDSPLPMYSKAIT